MFKSVDSCCKKVLKRLDEIWDVVNCIHADVIRILKWIALKKIDFVQVGGCCMNNSIVRGTAGSFAAVLTPANGAQAAGTVPQWSADDASIVLSPSADGLACGVEAPAGSTVTTFNLKITAVSSDPAVGTVSNSHPISVTEPPPPALQAIDFTQTAG